MYIKYRGFKCEYGEIVSPQNTFKARGRLALPPVPNNTKEV